MEGTGTRAQRGLFAGITQLQTRIKNSTSKKKLVNAPNDARQVFITDEVRRFHREAFLALHVRGRRHVLDETHAVSHRVRNVGDSLLIGLVFRVAGDRSEANAFEEDCFPSRWNVRATVKKGDRTVRLNCIRGTTENPEFGA